MKRRILPFDPKKKAFVKASPETLPMLLTPVEETLLQEEEDRNPSLSEEELLQLANCARQAMFLGI